MKGEKLSRRGVNIIASLFGWNRGRRGTKPKTTPELQGSRGRYLAEVKGSVIQKELAGSPWEMSGLVTTFPYL